VIGSFTENEAQIRFLFLDSSNDCDIYVEFAFLFELEDYSGFYFALLSTVISIWRLYSYQKAI